MEKKYLITGIVLIVLVILGLIGGVIYYTIQLQELKKNISTPATTTAPTTATPTQQATSQYPQWQVTIGIVSAAIVLFLIIVGILYSTYSTGKRVGMGTVVPGTVVPGMAVPGTKAQGTVVPETKATRSRLSSTSRESRGSRLSSTSRELRESLSRLKGTESSPGAAWKKTEQTQWPSKWEG